MRESIIEAYLVKRVKALGGECRKIKWIGRAGAPDRLVMLPTTEAEKYLDYCADTVRRIPGIALRASAIVPSLIGRITIWVELKATGVPAEAHQLREHERMRRMGQRVVVIDSIEGVEELLR